MGVLQPAPGVARCVILGTCDNVNIVNVLHVKKTADTSPFSQGNIDALAAGFSAAFKTRFSPSLTSSYTFKQCTCTDLHDTLGVVGVVAMTGAGGGTASVGSNANCSAISWSIPLHYRGGHPRTYLGPISTASVVTGTTLTPTFVTTLTTAANGFISDVAAIAGTGASVKLCCLHRKSQGVDLVPPVADVITAAVVDSRIDTQRRRLGRDR